MLVAGLVCIGGIVSADVTLFVSPEGNDRNTGAESQPFKTVDKARRVIRNINKHMTTNVVVYLRGGEYPLNSTLLFDQNDSGMNGFNVIYKGYPGERPVITGGKKITGWVPMGDGVYKASVGTLRFRQLYVNGVRATRARAPNAGSYYQLRSWDTTNKKIEINAGEISDWQRLNGVEMVVLGKGVNQANLRIGSFFSSGRSNYFKKLISSPVLTKNSFYRRLLKKLGVASSFVVPMEPERTRIFEQEYPPKESRPYYFENAFEFLDAPGEWYLNTATGEVFYKRRPGEDLASASVVVPCLGTLLKLQGTLDRPIHHIQFDGLTFEYTTWLLPDAEGYIGDAASVVFTQRLPADQISSYPGYRLPAGLHMEVAHSIRLERNIFRHMGASGLNLYVGTYDNQIVGNVITDVSGSGISVDLNLEGNPADSRKICRRDVITNNYISRVGRDYYQSVGIMAGYTDSVIIEHNELNDMPYSGICVGWGWADVDNAARNNLLRFNEVSNVLNVMSDGGGIYTLSRQPGTLIAENYIHDLMRPSTAGGFTNGGVFIDNGSNFITVRDNVFQNVQDMNIKLNDVGPNNVLSNNDGSSPTVIAKAGLEPEYRDMKLLVESKDTLPPKNLLSIKVPIVVLLLVVISLLTFYCYKRYYQRSHA